MNQSRAINAKIMANKDEKKEVEYPHAHPRGAEISVKKQALTNMFIEAQNDLEKARKQYKTGNDAFKLMGAYLKASMDKLNDTAKYMSELQSIIEEPKI